MFACAAFCKESRMKFLDSTKLPQEIRGKPLNCSSNRDAEDAKPPIFNRDGFLPDSG